MSNSADKTDSDPAGDSGEEVLDLTEEVDPGEASLDEEESDEDAGLEEPEVDAEAPAESPEEMPGARETIQETPEKSESPQEVPGARETIQETPEDAGPSSGERETLEETTQEPEDAESDGTDGETPSAAVVSRPGKKSTGAAEEDADSNSTTPEHEAAAQDADQPPAVFQTIQMEAVDRTVIEREGQMRQLEQTESLDSSKFAPEIIVRSPRSVITDWHSEMPGTETSAAPEPETDAEETSRAALVPTEPGGHSAASSPTEPGGHSAASSPTEPSGHSTPSSPTDESTDERDDQDVEASQPPPQPEESDPASADHTEAPATDEATQSPPPVEVETATPPSEEASPAEVESTETPEPPSNQQPGEADDPAEMEESIPVVEPEEDEVVTEVEEVEEVQPAGPGVPTAPQGHDSAPPERPQPPETPDQPETSTDEDDQKDEELSEIVEELVEEDEAEQRDRDEWVERVFGELYLSTVPGKIKEKTKREADFIEGRMSLDEADQVLDLACGFGRHTLELTERGHNVVGFDLSKPLLKQGLAEAERRSLNINFFHGDMRTLDFENVFDACICWQTSFGYFGDRTNLDILARINRALTEGGEFLVDVMNRDHIIQKMPHRIWWEGLECIFLEEGEFDYETSTMHMNRSFI
ncbi:MAG: methyltransferase domain-containing protein, partial [Bradymonadaceae bacterium]